MKGFTYRTLDRWGYSHQSLVRINHDTRGTMGMCLELFLVLSLISNDDMWVENVGGCPYCVCVLWIPIFNIPSIDDRNECFLIFLVRDMVGKIHVIHNDKNHPQVWGSLLALLLLGIMERDALMVGEWYRFITGFTTLPRNNFRTLQVQTRQCIVCFLILFRKNHPNNEPAASRLSV